MLVVRTHILRLLIGDGRLTHRDLDILLMRFMTDTEFLLWLLRMDLALETKSKLMVQSMMTIELTILESISQR